MEFILEIIAEIIFGIGVDVSTDKRISKWIRYPIIVIILLFFVGLSTALFFFVWHLIKISQEISAIFILVIAIMIMIFLFRYTKRLFHGKN